MEMDPSQPSSVDSTMDVKARVNDESFNPNSAHESNKRVLLIQSHVVSGCKCTLLYTSYCGFIYLVDFFHFRG